MASDALPEASAATERSSDSQLAELLSQEAGQTANQQLLLCIELGAAESYDKLLELPKEARLENAVQRAKS